MGNLEDLTGKIYGDFKVIKFDNTKGKYKYYWICECTKCGKEKSIVTSSLKTEKSTKCTCNTQYNTRTVINGYEEDLTRLKFGDITVNSFSHKKHSHSHWNCTCKCGNEIVRSISYLRNSKILKCNNCRVLDNQKENPPKRYVPKVPLSFEEYNYNTKPNKIETNGDITILNDRVIIDTKNLELILSYKRYVAVNSGDYPYMNWKGRELFLHRLIVGLPQCYDPITKLISDHINGKRCECLESNLRIIKHEYNPINCTTYKNNTSGIKGLSWNKDRKKWQVTLNYNKEQHYLGLYTDKEEAIKVRKEAELKYFGEYRREEDT